jgi:hypothetical protein
MEVTPDLGSLSDRGIAGLIEGDIVRVRPLLGRSRVTGRYSSATGPNQDETTMT